MCPGSSSPIAEAGTISTRPCRSGSTRLGRRSTRRRPACGRSVPRGRPPRRRARPAAHCAARPRRWGGRDTAAGGRTAGCGAAWPGARPPGCGRRRRGRCRRGRSAVPAGWTPPAPARALRWRRVPWRAAARRCPHVAGPRVSRPRWVSRSWCTPQGSGAAGSTTPSSSMNDRPKEAHRLAVQVGSSGPPGRSASRCGEVGGDEHGVVDGVDVRSSAGNVHGRRLSGRSATRPRRRPRRRRAPAGRCGRAARSPACRPG